MLPVRRRPDAVGRGGGRERDTLDPHPLLPAGGRRRGARGRPAPGRPGARQHRPARAAAGRAAARADPARPRPRGRPPGVPGGDGHRPGGRAATAAARPPRRAGATALGHRLHLRRGAQPGPHGPGGRRRAAAPAARRHHDGDRGHPPAGLRACGRRRSTSSGWCRPCGSSRSGCAGTTAARWRCASTSPTSCRALPAAVEVAAYRIVLEALTNVARHTAAATCVRRAAHGSRAAWPSRSADDDTVRRPLASRGRPQLHARAGRRARRHPDRRPDGGRRPGAGPAAGRSSGAEHSPPGSPGRMAGRDQTRADPQVARTLAGRGAARRSTSVRSPTAATAWPGCPRAGWCSSGTRSRASAWSRGSPRAPTATGSGGPTPSRCWTPRPTGSPHPAPSPAPGSAAAATSSTSSLARQRSLKAEVVAEQLRRLAGLGPAGRLVEAVPGDVEGLRWRTRHPLRPPPRRPARRCASTARTSWCRRRLPDRGARGGVTPRRRERRGRGRDPRLRGRRRRLLAGAPRSARGARRDRAGPARAPAGGAGARPVRRRRAVRGLPRRPRRAPTGWSPSRAHPGAARDAAANVPARRTRAPAATSARVLGATLDEPFDLVVLDPPREGARAEVVRAGGGPHAAGRSPTSRATRPPWRGTWRRSPSTATS